MVIAFVTTVIFFVIVLSLRHVMRMNETTHDKHSEKKRKGVIQNADIISLAALIVSIIVTGIYESALIESNKARIQKTLMIHHHGFMNKLKEKQSNPLIASYPLGLSNTNSYH